MPRIAWLRSHSASVVSSIGALEATPALDTTMSTPPKAPTAAWNAAATAASEVTSPSAATRAVAQLRGRLGRPRHRGRTPRRRRRPTPALDDRAPDAAGGAGDQRHLPWSSPGGGAGESL